MATFNITEETKKKKDQMDVSLANMDKAAADYNKMNYGSFVQGDDYKALSQRYQQNGQMAMKDTLGQMAARTGGMASSYANSAAQQSYNGYMEKLEDAARSLYDSQRQEKMDALSVASSIYDRDRAAYETGHANDYKLWEEDYDRVRDAKADADALKSEWTTTISNAAYNEKGLIWADYNENIPRDANGNPIISEAEFNALVNAAGQAYKSDTWQQNESGRAAADERVQSYINNPSWQWGDWDNDGMVGDDDTNSEGSANEFFAGSSQGENYWKNIHDKHKEDSKIKGYKDAAGIVTALTDSATLSLSEQDQENFDYIYGEGAYADLRQAIGNLDTILNQAALKWNSSGEIASERDSSGEIFEEYLEKWITDISAVIPRLTRDQLLSIVEQAAPEFMDFIDDPTQSDKYYRNSKVYHDGKWVTAHG